jgi:hypothetical protein
VPDCVTILKSLLAEQETNYVGELYSLQHYRAEWAHPKPPLIYVGAAGIADGTMMSDAPLALMPELMSWVDAARGSTRWRCDYTRNRRQGSNLSAPGSCRRRPEPC